MKASMSLKAVALVLAMGAFAFAGAAKADDDDDGAGVAIGIIGQVIGGAIEAEAEKEASDDQERRCRRFNRRCEDGAPWACEKFEAECGDAE